MGSLTEHRKRDMAIDKSIRLAKGLVNKGVYQGLIIAGDFNYGSCLGTGNWSRKF